MGIRRIEILVTSRKTLRVAQRILPVLALCITQQLYAQQSLVHLGPFLPDQTAADPNLASLMENNLSTRLGKIGYRVEKAKGNTLSDRLSAAKSAGAALLVEGYYKPSGEARNLTLYALIYNAQTGFLIDAVALKDEIEALRQEGVPIRLEELKEPDDKRLRDFEERFVIQIRSNPRFVESHEHVVENVINPGLDKRYSIPVQREDVKQQASEVFNLLAGQVTTASTKVASRVIEAPAVLDIISGEDIVSAGYKTINDVLFHLPGFAPSQDYDRTTVSFRGAFEGWNNNHLLMLVDGVQFNDILFGTAYTWEPTPIEMIKSMEVVRGPGSALYGSNAVNGVISIHTYSGEDLGGKLVTRVRGGDAGTQILDVMTGNKNQYFSYMMIYNANKTNGNNYMDYDGSGRTDPNSGYLMKFPTRDNKQGNYFMLKLQGEDFLKGLTIEYHNMYWDYQTGHGWIWIVPDFSESMLETIQNAFISYNSKLTTSITQEYVLAFQRHDLDQDTRFAPNNAFGVFYPTGATKYLKTGAQQYFGRAQWTYAFGNGGSALAGFEGKQFLYQGDQEHYANFNATDSADGFPPFADNAFHPLGPYLQWIKDQPVPTYSAYGQIITGKLLDNHVEVTLGTRYDEENVKFRAIDQPFNNYLGLPTLITAPTFVTGAPAYYLNYPSSAFGFPFQPEQHRDFRRTSPRAGLVFFITKDWSVKLLTGSAFRVPSVTELFGANTFFLASSPRTLKPEVIRTTDLATDCIINKYLNYRANIFWNRFENEIGYSPAALNLSANIYTLATVGFENELLFGSNTFGGSVSYYYNKRVGEIVKDITIAPSPNQTTWAPSHTASAGVHATVFRKFDLGANAEHQGEVYRRTSDFGAVDILTKFGPLLSGVDPGGTPWLFSPLGTGAATPIVSANGVPFIIVAGDPFAAGGPTIITPLYRQRSVPAWTDMSGRCVYHLTDSAQLGFSVRNMFNTAQKLIKNFNFPFDYQREGRRYLVEFNAKF